jgi:hypothetical protein
MSFTILCLHQMGDPRRYREAVRALEFMFAAERADCDVVVHDADLPLPKYLQAFPFDLIVLGPTFLGARQSLTKLRAVKERYGFIQNSQACKVALPQDDYDCSQRLDDWMVDWKVDRVYTVIPDHWDRLYPRYSTTNRLRLGFTAYIASSWIARWANPRTSDLRRIDVSYRTHPRGRLSCRLRNLKFDIAQRFLSAASTVPGAHEMRLDISADEDKFIAGAAWQEFVENSRFCLTTPSGSSLLDPCGEIRQRIQQASSQNPGATYAEIWRDLPESDQQKLTFSAISPRNIEAALAMTVQLATPGSYSGILHAPENCISLAEDCSNIEAVVEIMKDRMFCERVSHSCREAFLDVDRLRQSVFVDEVIDFAGGAGRTKPPLHAADGHSSRETERYRLEAGPAGEVYWRRQRLIQGFKSSIRRIAGRRVVNLVRQLLPKTP